MNYILLDGNALLQQALAMFMEDPATSLATRDTGTSGTATDDQNLVFALQLPMQNIRKDSTSQIDMIKDLPASMQGESRF